MIRNEVLGNLQLVMILTNFTQFFVSVINLGQCLTHNGFLLMLTTIGSRDCMLRGHWVCPTSFEYLHGLWFIKSFLPRLTWLRVVSQMSFALPSSKWKQWNIYFGTVLWPSRVGSMFRLICPLFFQGVFIGMQWLWIYGPFFCYWYLALLENFYSLCSLEASMQIFFWEWD